MLIPKMKTKTDKAKLKLPLQQISAIHGLVYLTLGGKKRYGWLFIIICNLVFTVYLITVIKYRFDSSLIYTRVDGTCRVNQVPFPSVIICNANTISHQQTTNIRNILTSHKRNVSEIDEFFEAIFQLTHYASPDVGHFPEVMSILESHYFNVDSIMEEIHQQCGDLLLHCKFNGVVLNCGEVFQSIKTVEGYCCAFNYAAANGNMEEYDVFSEDNDDIEVYDKRQTRDGAFIISTSKSGRESGLTVLFNVQPQDYPHWSKTQFYGAKILIGDPNDFPETTLTTAFAELGCDLNLLIEPMIFLSEPIIRRVPQEQRQCWFHDEMNLAYTDSYSFETCQTECNINKYLYYCGCVPYKYPREFSTRPCGLADLRCLHNLIVSDLATSCFCAHECSDRKYKVTQHKIPLAEDHFPINFVKKVNMSEAVGVSVYYGRSTCNCYKKSLLMDMARLVGTYGGVFSLSLGASIVTVVEIVSLLIHCIIRRVRRAFGSQL